MEDLKWHIVSKEERDKIDENIKEILKNFSKKLENINIEEKHFSSFNNLSGFREEGEFWQTNNSFKDIIFLNAPFVEDDFIISEKASWIK